MGGGGSFDEGVWHRIKHNILLESPDLPISFDFFSLAKSILLQIARKFSYHFFYYFVYECSDAKRWQGREKEDEEEETPGGRKWDFPHERYSPRLKEGDERELISHGIFPPEKDI